MAWAVANPGQAAAQTFGAITSAVNSASQMQQQQQIIQIEKQKQNLASFGALQSLANLPPDQIQNAAPYVAQAAGIDLTDPTQKANWNTTVKNMSDSQSQVGQTIMDWLKKIDPQTAQSMTPSQALKMLGTPAGVKSLMNLSMTKQIMDQSNITSPPDQSRTATTPMPTSQGIPSPLPVSTPAPQGSGPMPGETPAQQIQRLVSSGPNGTSGVPTPPPVAAQISPAGMGGNGPATMGAAPPVMPAGGTISGQNSGINGTGNPPPGNTSIGSPKMYSDQSARADMLDKQAAQLSVINPQSANVLSSQANNLRTQAASIYNAAQTNKVGTLNADTEAGKLALAQTKEQREASDSKVDQQIRTGQLTVEQGRLAKEQASAKQTPMPQNTQNALGLFPGTVAAQDGNGTYKVISAAPDASVKNYMDQVNQVHQDASSAGIQLKNLNTYSSMLNAAGEKPAAGLLSGIQGKLAETFSSLGYPDFATGVTGSNPLSEASKAIIQQQMQATISDPNVRSRLGVSEHQIELAANGLPENLDTRDAQNLMITVAKGMAIQKIDAEAVLNQHVATYGNPWTRGGDDGKPDITKPDGLEKATNILRNTEVPAQTKQAIGQASGVVPTTITPPTPSAIVPKDQADLTRLMKIPGTIIKTPRGNITVQ